jgi:hypothetical protein
MDYADFPDSTASQPQFSPWRIVYSRRRPENLAEDNKVEESFVASSKSDPRYLGFFLELCHRSLRCRAEVERRLVTDH